MHRVCAPLPTYLRSQDKIDVGLSQQNEMQDQKSMFEEKLAQSARSASDQQTSFDNQMARATLDAASDMKAAYEQGALNAYDDADEMRRSSIEVCIGIGQARSTPCISLDCLLRLIALHNLFGACLKGPAAPPVV